MTMKGFGREFFFKWPPEVKTNVKIRIVFTSPKHGEMKIGPLSLHLGGQICLIKGQF